MGGPAWLVPVRQKGSLTGLDGGGMLRFSVNPEKIDFDDGQDLAENKAPGAPDAHRQWVGGATRTIKFELILDGRRSGGNVHGEISTLVGFTVGGGGFRGAPRVLLTIGGRTWEGYVDKVGRSETRFDPDLNCTFAKARVDFIIDLGF